ncbi:MAG: hypothetical protein BGO26_02045 [Actinobacteria bacterium 69-20]|nr:MAG: hypothetical protein BGO26_02045 [Actinobacteria bacterium 69-20]
MPAISHHSTAGPNPTSVDEPQSDAVGEQAAALGDGAGDARRLDQQTVRLRLISAIASGGWTGPRDRLLHRRDDLRPLSQVVESVSDAPFGVSHVNDLVRTVTLVVPAHIFHGQNVVPGRHELPDKIGPTLTHAAAMLDLVRDDRFEETEKPNLRKVVPPCACLRYRIDGVDDDRYAQRQRAGGNLVGHGVAHDADRMTGQTASDYSGLDRIDP